MCCSVAGTTGCRTQEPKGPHGAAAEPPQESPDQADEGASSQGVVHSDNAEGPGTSSGQDAPSQDGDSEENGEVEVEEQLALDSVKNRLSNDADDGEPQSQGPLRFVVIQQGPRQPWVMGVVNQGPGTASLVADPRLLEFEVQVPGKKAKATCTLPDSLRPARAQRRYRVWLEPGQGVVKAFDPRLYCFATSGQHVLVPGSIVTPRFGWPKKVKTVWKHGKKQTVELPQEDPFVARVFAEPDESDSESTGAQAPDANALKQLRAKPFALGSAYKEWSSVGLRRQRKRHSPIVIEMKQGSDAYSQLNATVAITLKNRGKRTHYVYFRRELLTFEVMGPGGWDSCDPQPDTRAPDRQAFLHLAPGQSMTITSRLVELCPKGTFARPGFYLVHARFDADENGEDYGLDAYVGRVASEKPANVRIRTGELEPADKQPMRPLDILE